MLRNLVGDVVQVPPRRRCIVNYADGGWYRRGQDRLRLLCEKYGIHFRGYTDVPPRHYPPHQIVPYAFKAACVQDAVLSGYDTVCWMDASAVIQHDPAPIFEVAESLGAFVSANYGIKTGTWCTDEALRYFGLSRDEAFRIPHCSALVCCFCVSHIVGAKLWDDYNAAALSHPSPFLGPHSAKSAPHLFAPDTMGRLIEGHRHDQTALSILAWKYGIPLQPNNRFVDYGQDRPDAIIAAYPA